jgi:hypothetical protein
MKLKHLAFLALLPALVFVADTAIPQPDRKASAPVKEAQPAGADIRPGYVGDTACLPCHRSESASYTHTAHRLTSQLAGKQTILGTFKPGGTVLTISDPATHPAEPALFFKMEARDGGFYQTVATGWGDRLLTRTESIDVVTGSGRRGQTYLYWQGDRLFELPVSYWTDGHRWVNSPGFIDGTVDFSRPINPGCLECHATYIRPLSTDPLTNSFDRKSLVTGISCETCHGPAAAHVAAYANRSPHDPAPAQTAILNPAKFSRDLQVDACAYCHSGIQRAAMAPAFSFVPGHALNEYFKPLQTEAAERPDVHGNQVGLLKRSRCYQSSPGLSCSTCHDTHAAEKPAASYSSACLQCHQWTSCGASRKLGHAIVSNCIDCHMPVQPTSVIASETAGQVVRAKMRNHWIKVYPGPQTH